MESLVTKTADAELKRQDTVVARARPTSHRAAPAAEPLPPVILLGGEANALSVARDLGGGLGATVYLLLEEAGTPIRWSRYAQAIRIAPQGTTGTNGDPRPPNTKAELAEAWADFLLGPESDHLRGGVLLTCSDTGIQMLSNYRERLLKKFRLDLARPAAALALLDKLSTYQIAKAADVPTPQFWEVTTREQVLALESQLVYPLMVKPRLSHVFQQEFGHKFVVTSNFAELLAAYDAASAASLDVLLMEYIPGPDSHLCSYFTYLDEQDQPLFHFTKRVIRRYPVGMGTGCYHVTDWIPELPPLGLKLFRQAGVQGLANVEFKLDTRDGLYKVIECNARFNASNSLISACGFNLSQFVYNRAAERTVQTFQTYQVGRRLLDPVRDFCAFRQLHRQRQLTLKQWVASLLHRQTFAYFAMTDPMPAVARAMRPFTRVIGRLRYGSRQD